LDCDAATLSGGIRIEGNLELNTTNWRSPDGVIQWQAHFPTAGEYRIALLYSSAKGKAGHEFTIAVGPASIRAQTTDTDGKFRRIEIGSIRVEQAGDETVAIKAAGPLEDDLMRLRTVELKRAP
jgi:hypothetical protein